MPENTVFRIQSFKRDIPRILFWFSLYILTAVGFGIAYHQIYQHNNAAFSITNNPYNQTLVQYRKLKTVLDYSQKKITDRAALHGVPFSALVAGKPIHLTDYLAGGSGTVHLYPLCDDPSQVKELPEPALPELQQAMAAYNSARENFFRAWKQLGDLQAFKQTESVIDFIYFSMVTLTTVGYGDMLPNNTLTRGLVASELIFFIFLTLFAIDYLRRHK